MCILLRNVYMRVKCVYYVFAGVMCMCVYNVYEMCFCAAYVACEQLCTACVKCVTGTSIVYTYACIVCAAYVQSVASGKDSNM